MKIKLLTLALASTLLTHCGSEHDSSGGSWDEKPKNQEEPAEPAKPATTAAPDLNKDKEKQPNAETTKKPTPATADTTPPSSAPAKKARKLGKGEITPLWNLTAGDWHARIEKVSLDSVVITVDKDYSNVLESVRLSFKEAPTEHESVYVSVPKRNWTTTQSLRFSRNEESGRCQVTYFEDALYDTLVYINGSCL